MSVDQSATSSSLGQNDSLSSSTPDDHDPILLSVYHDYQKQKELAMRLKECFDKKGKGLKAKSAAIFHQLGKIYDKSGFLLVQSDCTGLTPDESHQKIGTGMICLIQSAALFNAALVRLPKKDSNNRAEIEEDLKQLCSKVLLAASAKDKNADLCKQAATVKLAISKMRKKFEEKIKELKKIPKRTSKDRLRHLEEEKIDFIEKLQNEITYDYKQIMIKLAEFCEKVMGDPPCKYAVVGMGSMARKEITPYSDFEHIITLENVVLDFDELKKQKTFLYFRWFSVVFHVVVVNLQETIVRSVAVAYLNSSSEKKWNWFYDNITPRGISFDGMMPHACKFPLGRLKPTPHKNFSTELIKPINEMLEFLSSKVRPEKEGYHLEDILTKTCFVYGDKAIHTKFHEGVIAILQDQKKEEGKRKIKKQITDDLKKFATKSTLFKLYSEKKINIKEVAYRSSTLFVAALGKYYNIYEASSCFDIIKSLQKKKQITDFAEQKLMYAVAISCEIRLRWYTQKKRQADYIIKRPRERSAIDTFSDIAGKPSTISYFQIAYALQSDICNRLHLKKLYFHPNPLLLNLSIHFCLNDPRKTNSLIHKHKLEAAKTDVLHKFDDCLQLLLEDDSLTDLKKYDEGVNTEVLTQYFLEIGKLLQEMNCFDDALEFFRKSLQNLIGEEKLPTPSNIAQSNEAAEYLNNLRHLVLQSESFDLESKNKLAEIVFGIGRCLLDLKLSEVATSYFKICLDIRERISADVDNDAALIPVLYELGRCLNKCNKTDEAIKALKRSLKIAEKTSGDIEADLKYASALRLVGHLLKKKSSEAKSCGYLKKSLNIAKFVSEQEESRNAALTCDALLLKGQCLLDLKNTPKAQEQFKKLIEIKERDPTDVNIDKSYAKAMREMGQCLSERNQPEQAIPYLTSSRSITEQLSRDVETDSRLAKVCLLLGKCYLEINEATDALKCLETSLQIFEQISTNPLVDLKITNANHLIGLCYLLKKQPSVALPHLSKSEEIIEKMPRNPDIDLKLSKIREDLSECFIALKDPAKALDHINSSLDISQNFPTNSNTRQNKSNKLCMKGQSLRDINKPKSALECFKESVEIQRDLGIDNLSLATTYFDMGQCAMTLNLLDSALDYYEMSLRYKEKATNASGLSKALTMNAISLCLVQVGEKEKAVTQMKLVQEILKLHCA